MKRGNVTIKLFRITAVVLLATLLAACGSSGGKKPTTSTASGPKVDGPPAVTVDVSKVPAQVPRPEPRARYGNQSPYVVLGKTYTVMSSSEGYTANGIASWYGQKFHGRRTSSGEVYDLNQFTAAHKSLPLPTFVEVTNLDNNRKLIVRVNDRGPFHSDRVIDLSYAAALKLDVVRTGTARVALRAIDVRGTPSEQRFAQPRWLQVGAFAERSRAYQIRDKLEDARLGRIYVESTGRGSNRLWRVQLGPYNNEADIQSAESRIRGLGLGTPSRILKSN